MLRLNFAYQGVEVRSAAEGEHLFVAEGSAVAAIARDFEAEARARRVLEGFGAVELGCLETYERESDSEADYLVRVDGDVHAFCSFSAYVVPQLRALGFRVEIDDAYDYHVIEGDAPWYAAVTPESDDDEGGWFGLELGVEIRGERINLLPFLVELVETASDATSFKSLARTSNRFMAIPTGDGRYLPVPPERLKLLLKVVQELYQSGSGTRGIRVHEFQCDALVELGEALGEADFLSIHNADGDDVREVSRCDPARRGQTAGGSAGDAAAVPGRRPRLAAAPARARRGRDPRRRHGARQDAADDRTSRGGKGGRAPDEPRARRHADEPHRQLAARARSSPRDCAWSCSTAPRGARAGRKHANADVVLTTYPVLSRDLETAKSHEFHLLILDEAQTIKNPRSLVNRACRMLDARHRLCLSGTPIENNLGELWALFDFLMPGLLGDAAEQFRTRFRTPIEQGQSQERARDPARQASRPFILRRTKEAVATELPPKTEFVRPVELTGRQRDLYESIRVAAHARGAARHPQEGLRGSAIAILDALMKLRQVCCDPRLVTFEAARDVRESAKFELCMSLIDSSSRKGRRDARLLAVHAACSRSFRQGLATRASDTSRSRARRRTARARSTRSSAATPTSFSSA